MCRSFVRWFAESEKWSGVFLRPSVRRPSVNSGKCLSDMKIDNVRWEKRSIGEAGRTEPREGDFWIGALCKYVRQRGEKNCG